MLAKTTDSRRNPSYPAIARFTPKMVPKTMDPPRIPSYQREIPAIARCTPKMVAPTMDPVEILATNTSLSMDSGRNPTENGESHRALLALERNRSLILPWKSRGVSQNAENRAAFGDVEKMTGFW